MITPSDIQTKVFDKAVRGYREEDVDVFLDELTTDYDAVLKENESLKQRIIELGDRIEEYKNQESTVLQTLETAKSLMNDISSSAEKRAEILLKNAELDADLKQRQAKDNLERLQSEEAELGRRVASIRSRFKSILEAELERFDGLTEELFGQYQAAVMPRSSVDPATADALSRSIGLSDWDQSGDKKYNTITNLRNE